MRRPIFALAFFVPFLLDFIAVMYFENLRFIQVTPLLMTVTSIIFAYQISRENMLDLIPFARSLAMDSTLDLHLVFNAKEQLIDYNMQAESILQIRRGDLHKHKNEVFAKHGIEVTQHFSTQGSHYEIQTRELHLPHGQKLGPLVTLNDITLQKKIESDLRDINTVKTQLLGVLGHDLQSHLASLSLISEDLSKHADKYAPEDIKAHAEHIHHATRTCVTFVEDFLTWSKSQLGGFQIQKDQIDLENLCRKVLVFFDPLLSQRAIEIRIHNHLNTPIESDPQVLSIILRNLVSNAIKFSPEHSHVDITLRDIEGFHEISIRDQGKGISPEALPLLIEASFVTSRGFGLPVSREFAARLGGELWAESKLGQGSTFGIRLPKNFP
jgi:signal transduction histidine kinase